MQDTSNSIQEFQNPNVVPKFLHVKFSNKCIIFIICIYLLSGIFETFFYPIHQGKYLGYIQGVAQLLFMLLPTLLFSRLSPLPFKTLFRLESKLDLKLLSISIIGIIALSVFETSYLFMQEKFIPDFLLEIYKTTEKAMNDMYNQILGGSGWIDGLKALAIGAIIPSITEESLFRGFYQRSLEEELKPYLAILISGLIFAVIHLNPITIVPLLIIGLFLGVVAYGTRSLIIPIILHFLNNAVVVLVMYTPSLLQLDSQSYNLTITSAIILSIISFTVLSLVTIFIYRKGKN